jgi:para-aminobenzoate synthetase/4-amino-4-deoxychorismate lyase
MSSSVDALEAMRVPLPSGMDVAQAIRSLRGDRRPFALAGDWLGGLCVMSSEPAQLATAADDPFSVLDDLAGRVHEADRTDALVGGGWVGWLGYGLGALIERLPPAPPAPVPRPRSSLAFYDHVVVFDGERWWFEALWSDQREPVLRSRLALWEARLAAPPPTGEAFALDPFQLASNGAAGHLDAVAQCRERIAAGELFQANLCVRLESRLHGDPIDLFAAAVQSGRPRFGALVDGAVSLSPERFLRRIGRSVSTEPIKGTRPRSALAGEELAAREELVASAKDAAEHVMIVDLMRNDLGRVSVYGSIRVEPPRVEAHAGVWHLVSTVSGTLRPGVGDGELLRAAFPPGSVTGAPKVQAMKVISELEATRRELYTGAIGIVSPLAGLDLSVAIRTFEISGESVWFGAGGGIVADSDLELELAEALAKARGPIAAVGGELATDLHSSGHGRAAIRSTRWDSSVPRAPARGTRPDPHGLALGTRHDPHALAHGTRPDPAGGVFETILVRGGQPLALEAHLERLVASARVLYGSVLDISALASAALAECARAGGERSRLRVLLDQDGSVGFDVSPAAGVGSDRPAPIVLTPFLLPGGLGAHKWRDRSLLERLAALEPGTVPLLVDTDGAVLEASFANVWIEEEGALLTPPADGRLLPGVTRVALLAADPGAREDAIDLVRMERADAIFLTSSVSHRLAARIALANHDLLR